MSIFHVSSPIKLCFTGLLGYVIYEIHIAMQQNVDIESTEPITITTANNIHTNLNIIRQMSTHDADLQMSKIKLKLWMYGRMWQ